MSDQSVVREPSRRRPTCALAEPLQPRRTSIAAVGFSRPVLLETIEQRRAIITFPPHSVSHSTLDRLQNYLEIIFHYFCRRRVDPAADRVRRLQKELDRMTELGRQVMKQSKAQSSPMTRTSRKRLSVFFNRRPKWSAKAKQASQQSLGRWSRFRKPRTRSLQVAKSSSRNPVTRSYCSKQSKSIQSALIRRWWKPTLSDRQQHAGRWRACVTSER